MQSTMAPRALLLLLCGLVVGAAPLHAQARSALTAPVAEAIEAVFSDIEDTAPGCAAGVVAEGVLVYGRGFGLANLDYGLPITPRSNFYLGSVGKQFTAAAVAHAERAGQLSLDDRIQEWVPEVPEYDRPVTVRHLIHHTSGLRDYLALGNLAGRRMEDVFTRDDVLTMVARQLAPNFPVGDEYLYSNTGYFLLGVILQRATGLSLREYLEQELLGPLGMTRTRVHDDRLDVLPDRVVGYASADGVHRMDHPWNFEQVGSGGVYSSLEDLVHWDRNYYTEEVGGPGFTERLRERGVLTDGSTIPYAFGLVHGEYRGLATVAHGGALAGFRSHLLRFPDERTTVLVLCNFPTADPAERARRVADAVLAERLEAVAAAGPEAEPRATAAEAPDREASDRKPVQLSTEQLDTFTGHWRASMGAEAEIRREDDQLVFIQGSTRAPLTVVSDRVLRLEGADLEMTLSDLRDGKHHTMSVVQRGQSSTASRFDPEAERRDHTPLVGEYYSDELRATYRVYEEEGRLMLEIPPTRRGRLYPLEDGRLRGPGMTLELQREGDAVVGFTIEAGRVRGIRFGRRPDR